MTTVPFALHQVEWDRTDSPIPVNSHYDGTRLVLPYISRADAGRYVCRIRYPDGATSETYVDVRVKGEYRRRRRHGKRRARPVRHPVVY